MKKKLYFIMLAVFAGGCLHGQSVTMLNSEKGIALPAVLGQIARTSAVDTLLVNHMYYKMRNPDVGYRVLIFSQSGNHSKTAAIEAKNDFDLIYPDYKTYISFEEPYFKVKAGNFTSRMEAEFFLRTIKPDYPYAFIVKDILDIADYLKLGM